MRTTLLAVVSHLWHPSANDGYGGGGGRGGAVYGKTEHYDHSKNRKREMWMWMSRGPRRRVGTVTRSRKQACGEAHYRNSSLFSSIISSRFGLHRFYSYPPWALERQDCITHR